MSEEQQEQKESNSDGTWRNTTPSISTSWSWMGVLGAAQVQASDMITKAQVIATEMAEKAKKEAENVIEIAKHYDIEAAKNSILSTTSLGATTTITPLPQTRAPKVHVLDFVYCTENVIAMAFPYDPKKDGIKEEGNDIRIVAKYLQRKHAGHYMIWLVLPVYTLLTLP